MNDPTLDTTTSLLDSSHSEMSWRGSINDRSPCNLTLLPDGSCIIEQQINDDITSTPWLPHLCTLSSSSSPLYIKIPWIDLVGASHPSPTATQSIQIYYMPIHNTSSSKPIRELRKSPSITLESTTHAIEVINAIQDRVMDVGCYYHNSSSSDSIDSNNTLKHHPTPTITMTTNTNTTTSTTTTNSNNKRTVLVIINPTSGRQTAPSLFTSIVQPILTAAGITIIHHTTTHRHHATEIIKHTTPQDNISAILALGGDGTTFEVLQGVLQRDDWDDMRKIPIVQIPGGSGNALAACCGLWDAATAVHAVVKGCTRKLDVASIVQEQSSSNSNSGGGGGGSNHNNDSDNSNTHNNNSSNTTTTTTTTNTIPSPSYKRFFSFLSITYGMISSLDVGTEHLRFLGGTRFLLGGLHQAIQQYTFEVRVAYKPYSNDDGGGVNNVDDDSNTNSSNSNTLNSTTNNNNTTTNTTNTHYHFDNEEGPPLSIINTALLNSSTQSLPPGWKWISGNEIQLFAACNLPRLDMNFLFAPDATLDSGHINILYTCGRAGVKKSLELLTLSGDGKHMHMVEQCRAVAMRIEPLAAAGRTWLVVDGEAMPHSVMYAEVHPQLCTVICAP